jgi:hypothetical protein
MATVPTITVHSDKFAFHQHNALTRAEAIYMLYNLSAAVATNHTHWSVSLTESKFLDVSEDDYYYDAVLWAEQYGITSGITENIFGGGNVCTRAMFVTMLFAFNWQGQTPNVVSGNAYFSDVPVYSYYFNPVKWAYIKGLVAGDGDGHFMPDNPITRETACAILYKYLDSPSYPSSVADNFMDLAGEVVIAPWYYVAVVKLWNEFIIDGYADGTYKPGNYITRGQFVTMLYAAAGRPSISGLEQPFTDVTSDMYCYDAVAYCYDIGVISGTSETTFSPDRAMLRKEMLQVLFMYGNYEARYNPNLEYFDPDGQEDSDATAASGFEAAADVPNTAYYYNAVIWGVMHGITTLSPGHMFHPDQKATRAMAAQMLYKLLKILNDWEDDTAAEIDGTRTYTKKEETECLLTWEQGSIDDNGTLNDDDLMVISTQYIPITVGGLGTANKFAFVVSSGYKWMCSFFTTQGTLVSGYNRSWRNGNGVRTTLSVPTSANYVRFSIKSASSSSSTDDWSIAEDRWAVGSLDTDTGRPDTSITSHIYSRTMYQVADVGLTSLTFNVSGGTRFDVIRLFFYDQNRNYISDLGGFACDTEIVVNKSRFPAGAYWVRFDFAPEGTATPAEGERITITATSSGDSLYPSDGDVARARAYGIVETIITDVGVTDIKKWTVDYTDAVLACYNEGVIADPMLDRAPMKVTLENTRGTASTMVEEKDSTVPELVVVDGENEFTVEGEGTYRIQFKRGSL